MSDELDQFNAEDAEYTAPGMPRTQEERITEETEKVLELFKHSLERNIRIAVTCGALSGAENDWAVACAILKLTADSYESETSIQIRRKLAYFI